MDVARLFSMQAEDFHALTAQAAEFHEQFTQNLIASAEAYSGTEAINAGLLMPAAAAAASAQDSLSTIGLAALGVLGLPVILPIAITFLLGYLGLVAFQLFVLRSPTIGF